MKRSLPKRTALLIGFALLLLTSCATKNITSPDGRISARVSDSTITVSYNRQEVQKISTGIPIKLGKNMELKVRNDGIAFRFLVGEQKVSYHVCDGLKRWLGPFDGINYEVLFPCTQEWQRGRWAYPMLVEYGDGVFGLVAETGIRHGHSCSYLVSDEKPEWYSVRLTDGTNSSEVTPWRTIVIGTLSELVASEMMTNLAEPCAIEDTSWIKPGSSSWIYWAHNHGSKDFNLIVEYIDLAAEMHWPYCLVDWEWPEMRDGTIEEVVDYAKEMGVNINLWYNSGTFWKGPGAPQPEDRIRDKETREKEFAWLEELGVTGVKVDFFAPDGAEMVDLYLDILEDAARHHLLVDFHGCTIPHGWQRTWPNLMSMEGVYGAEWYNNVPTFTAVAASHNATLPFTRALMGPMDYTPCTFSDSQHPHITTYGHELALAVLFQSGLQHLADRPSAYLSLPDEVRSMLIALPSVWDETQLLSGYPGNHAVIARRSGSRWYIAGINGTDEPQTLSFREVRGNITLAADGETDRSFSISHPEAVSSVDCLPRGGFLLIAEGQE